MLIGKDTRVSGYMLEAALEAGFSAAGVDVMLAGPMPTPGIAYLTRALRLAAGVVISASHNPYYDNGIKFFSADGDKLPDDVELKIEEQLDLPLDCAASEQLGKARRLDDAARPLHRVLQEHVPGGVRPARHEAGGRLRARRRLRRRAARVPRTGRRSDPDRRRAERLQHQRRRGRDRAGRAGARGAGESCGLGIALDGDADRLQVVDAAGRLYNGDELLYVLVKDRIATDGKVEGAVGTLMTNMAVEVALKHAGVKFVRAAVGDRYVLEKVA